MKKNKKNLLLISPLVLPLSTLSIINSIKASHINIIKNSEINNYNLQTETNNNVEDVVAAIKQKLKDKKIKFYNIDDWNNLTDTKNIVLTQITNVINQEGIFSNGTVLAFDSAQFDLQKISYNSTNQQIDLTLSYYKRDFKTTVLLDDQLVDNDYIIAISERIKQLNVSKKMFLFQKTGENINKLIKSEIYQWINDQLKTVVFKLNDKKIDVDLKLVSLLAFKNKIEKEKKIIATINYKNFTTNVDIASAIVNVEKFGKTLQNKINTLKIMADEKINYANVFQNANMKTLIANVLKLIDSSIKVDNSDVALNYEDFETIALDNQNKVEMHPWIKTVNLRFKHHKTNLIFNAQINFKYNESEKAILFNDILNKKIKTGFELTTGNDLLFLSTEEMKRKILVKLKENLDTNFSGYDYKFTFEFAKFSINNYKIIHENNKHFIYVYYSYKDIVTTTNQFIKIALNLDKNLYLTNFEKILKAIEKQIPKYPVDKQLNPDKNPEKAISWITNEIKANIHKININGSDTKINWEMFTFALDPMILTESGLDGKKHWVFTYSFTDEFGVQIKDKFYVLASIVNAVESMYKFSKLIYQDLNNYFLKINLLITDNSNFATLKQRYNRLVLPDNTAADNKIVNFFNNLSNIYLDFIKTTIQTFIDLNYTSVVYTVNADKNEPIILRFREKLKLLLQDKIEIIGKTLNKPSYVQSFNKIKWNDSIEGGDYDSFFDSIYILNQNLITDLIQYILK